MAIEYASNTGETPEPDQSGGPPQPDTPDTQEGETVDIPMSMLGGQQVNVGDVIRLRVVTVNQDSGTVSAEYATEKPNGSAIDEAASKFEA